MMTDEPTPEQDDRQLQDEYNEWLDKQGWFTGWSDELEEQFKSEFGVDDGNK